MDPLSWREGFHSNGHKSYVPNPSHALSWSRKENICVTEELWMWRSKGKYLHG